MRRPLQEEGVGGVSVDAAVVDDVVRTGGIDAGVVTGSAAVVAENVAIEDLGRARHVD